MPSITSHGVNEYYAHASNAFWWIVGEALGFRRGGPEVECQWPYQFQTKPSQSILQEITQTSSPVLNYQEQVDKLTEAGFALWDIIQECNIKNSDDATVSDSKPNNIRVLIEDKQPSIRRIVFASGKTSAKIFIKLNKSWLKEGNFCLGGGEFTSDVFSSFVGNDDENNCIGPDSVHLIVPYSVSPAAASVSFKVKKEQWLSCVFNS